MKLAMFTTIEGYRRYLQDQVNIQTFAVNNAQEYYNKVVRGENKEAWLKNNNTKLDDPWADELWAKHIVWAADVLRYHNRKLRKAQRELAKAQ